MPDDLRLTASLGEAINLTAAINASTEVPVYVGEGTTRRIVGTASINPDGTATVTITDTSLTPLLASDLDTTGPKCCDCGRQRTINDAHDYNPLQVITGKPLGWYSGDDCEMCPECMTKTLHQ